MTPHIEAKKGDYAEAVLLPGDPLRAEWVAKTFLDQPRLVNQVRNCLGYTGTYQGKPVSVQATGMGQPSLGIYVHELITSYDVKTLIRIGTCGALVPKVKLRDIVIAETASTDSAMNRDVFGMYSFAPAAISVCCAPPSRRPRSGTSPGTLAASSPAMCSITPMVRRFTRCSPPTACSASRWKRRRSTPSPPAMACAR